AEGDLALFGHPADTLRCHGCARTGHWQRNPQPVPEVPKANRQPAAAGRDARMTERTRTRKTAMTIRRIIPALTLTAALVLGPAALAQESGAQDTGTQDRAGQPA